MPGTERPIRTLKPWLLLLCWLCLAFVLFLVSDRRIAPYDGGLPLSLALRVLHGDAPHRDFYYQYGPLQPYLFAGLFRLFGVHMLPVAILEMLIRSAVILVSYAIVRCAVTPAWAALYSSVMAGFLALGGYPSASLDALLVVTGFVYLCATMFVAPPSARRAVGIGLLAGLASLYRYEQGPMLLVLGILMTWSGSLLRRSPRSTAEPMRVTGLLVIGYLAVVLPVFVFLAAQGALHDLWYQCFTFARTYYASARSLPFPRDPWHHFDRFVFYLPMVVPPVVLAGLVKSYFDDRDSLRSTRSALLFLLSLLGLVYAVKGSIRVDFGQMLPGNLMVFLIAGILLGTAVERSTRLAVFALTGVAFLSTLLNIKPLLRVTGKQHYLTAQAFLHRGSDADVPGWCSSASPLVTPYCFAMGADHERATLFLLQRMTPGDRLFVGLSHHDKVYVGDNLTYLATNTVPAVKWSHFDPDLQTRADIQQEMIANLKHWLPEYVLETSQFENNTEPNDSSKSSGVFLLDTYLKSAYEPVATFGPLTVLQRQVAHK